MVVTKNIELYSHEMGLSVQGRKIPKKWSTTLGGDPKSVEHAALDLFKSKGWCASRDTSMLIDFMLKLQLISCNEMTSSVVDAVLEARIVKIVIETRPIALKLDKKINGWLNADCCKSLINIFPDLQEDFSERDLVLNLMKSINGPFEGQRHYKEKIEEFVCGLDLSEAAKDEICFRVFLHYLNFKDKDFKIKKVMYHSGMGLNFDLVPMFDNIHLSSCEKMQVALLHFLPMYYEIWQNTKINEMQTGYKKRPLPKKMSEVRKLPEVSKESFYSYCVHGAKSAKETVSGLMKLYTSLPKTIWLDLVKFQTYRPEGFFYSTGIPDLIIWNGSDYEFVEIKSPNDTLQKSQLDYFENILEKLSLNYSVISVIDLSEDSTHMTR